MILNLTQPKEERAADASLGSHAYGEQVANKVRDVQHIALCRDTRSVSRMVPLPIELVTLPLPSVTRCGMTNTC